MNENKRKKLLLLADALEQVPRENFGPGFWGPPQRGGIGMNEDQRRELHILADGLEKVPREKFDMGVWGRGDSVCGFAGCAIGWAPSIIPNCGLQMVMSEHSEDFAPRFDGCLGMPAVARYFGLTPRQALYLFEAGSYVDVDCHPGRYRTFAASISPTTVATRIKSFLQECLTP